MLVPNENPRQPQVPPDGAVAEGGDERRRGHATPPLLAKQRSLMSRAKRLWSSRPTLRGRRPPASRNVQRCPARSPAWYCRSPYSKSVGSMSPARDERRQCLPGKTLLPHPWGGSTLVG